MIILAVDTSSSQGSLCLFKDSKILSHQSWSKQGSHSELITEKLQAALTDAKKNIVDIKKIYCGIGPGSFTGIRVGVSFCKTLSFANNLPLIPLDSLISLALSSQSSGSIVSLVDAQKNSIFFSHFNFTEGSINIIEDKKLLKINQLDNYIPKVSVCCGDGFSRYIDFLSYSLKSKLNYKEENKFINLAKVIPWDLDNNFFKETDWQQLRPLYIRPSSAEEKLSEKKS